MTGYPKSTISDIISKGRETGVIEDLPWIGRPKEITIEEENIIIEQ
jgi:transposase